MAFLQNLIVGPAETHVFGIGHQFDLKKLGTHHGSTTVCRRVVDDDHLHA